MQNSGKLLILAMLTVGLIAAGASWWFRYSATHRAAQFWGTDAARQIRDAPQVSLLQLAAAGSAANESGETSLADRNLTIVDRHDVSSAGGLTHLRTALLEDRSFNNFDVPDSVERQWVWALEFNDPAATKPVIILFTQDCTNTTLHGSPSGAIASSAPISSGLRDVFDEWSPANDSNPENGM